MDIAFATAQVDQADRLTAWRELVNRVFLPLAITPLPATGRAGEFGASVTGSDWGELRVWRVKATPMSAVRTVHHIESSARDDYLLALHISGTATGAQDDRQLRLGPGDFALFDPTRPYAIAFRGTGTFEHVIYQVPRASIDARWPAGNLTALGVPAVSSAGRLTSPYLRTLARTAGPSGDRPAQAFIDAVSFGAWLREQRLRRCRDDLTNQQLTHRAVSEIAARWGFRSAAHFTRAFHARYGITPAELRSHRLPGR